MRHGTVQMPETIIKQHTVLIYTSVIIIGHGFKAIVCSIHILFIHFFYVVFRLGRIYGFRCKNIFTIFPLACIVFAISINPFAVAVAFAVLPFAVIYITVSPTIDAMAVEFSINKISLVGTTACKNKLALSLSGIVLKFAVIHITVIPTINAVTVHISVCPISVIAVSVVPTIYALTMEIAVLYFTFVATVIVFDVSCSRFHGGLFGYCVVFGR